MREAVLVDCVRTPFGRAHNKRGVFRRVRSDDLAVPLVKALVERTGIDPARVEDVIFGTTRQAGETGVNVGRMIGLCAGLPFSIAGTTVNRLCGSSLQAINQAAHSIIAGAEDVHIVGGIEHMDHLPMELDFSEVNPQLFERTPLDSLYSGRTAEYLARLEKVSREEQDVYALESHQKATTAHARGEFKEEMVPIWGHDQKGNSQLVDFDQSVRSDTSLDALAALQPVFDPQGSVTAGNSSPMNDGAAAVLMMARQTADELKLKPRAKVVASAVAGTEPYLMGTAPVYAVRKALDRAGLKIGDVGLWELHESFAVQAIVCQRRLEIDPEKINVRGGSLAIGHPLGASGARITATLLNTMRDRNVRYGVATMCIGIGQGIATVYELLD